MCRFCWPIVLISLSVLVLSQLHLLINTLTPSFPFIRSSQNILFYLIRPWWCRWAAKARTISFIFYSSSRPHLYFIFLSKMLLEDSILILHIVEHNINCFLSLPFWSSRKEVKICYAPHSKANSKAMGRKEFWKKRKLHAHACILLVISHIFHQSISNQRLT